MQHKINPNIMLILNRRKIYAIGGACCFFGLLYITSFGDVQQIPEIPMLKRVQYIYSNAGKKTCDYSLLEHMKDFFAYFKQDLYKCSNMRAMGGNDAPTKDGSKMICFDKNFDIKPHDCVVFSFGTGNEWSFDDAMDKFGCKIYAFDPTLGLKDHHRSPNIQFFNKGISDYKGNQSLFGHESKVDTYRGIVNSLGLENTMIDIFKIDIEGHEIVVLLDVIRKSPHLLQNVKQITMEIHPLFDPFNIIGPLQRPIFYWRIFQELECIGFKLMFEEVNPFGLYKYNNETVSAYHELSFVRPIQWG